ncbi:MAG: DUF2141 domain-containing protein [Cyanobacteria bacterium P01_A01_bin.40]
MTKWFASLLIFTTGYFCFPPRVNSSTSSLIKVEIEGLQEAEGQICYSLFDKDEGFPDSKDNILRAECLSIKEQLPVLTIDNLHRGTYALALFHDVNQDEELNRNFFGIPQEGFGFSQNPEITTSPPSFGESAISVVGTETTLQVQLRYF